MVPAGQEEHSGSSCSPRSERAAGQDPGTDIQGPQISIQSGFLEDPGERGTCVLCPVFILGTQDSEGLEGWGWGDAGLITPVTVNDF